MAKDLTGHMFGRLTVLERAGSDRNKKALWLCRCECGQITKAITGDLTSGNTKSCGCFKREQVVKTKTKHGQSRSRLYDVYYSMLGRCYRKTTEHFRYYGGRGIAVCDEWRSSFSAFAEWAKASGYHEGLSIDRIDTNGNYSPSNCRWASKTEQTRNRKNTLRFRDKPIAQWCEELKVKYGTVKRRIYLGWPMDKALGLGGAE